MKEAERMRLPGTEMETRAYLGLLSVDPEDQRSGIGSMLMRAAESFCATLDAGSSISGLVNLRQEMPAFYKRRGYVETGTAPFR